MHFKCVTSSIVYVHVCDWDIVFLLLLLYCIPAIVYWPIVGLAYISVIGQHIGSWYD